MVVVVAGAEAVIAAVMVQAAQGYVCIVCIHVFMCMHICIHIIYIYTICISVLYSSSVYNFPMISA